MKALYGLCTEQVNLNYPDLLWPDEIFRIIDGLDNQRYEYNEQNWINSFTAKFSQKMLFLTVKSVFLLLWHWMVLSFAEKTIFYQRERLQL